jgi:RNA polymerase sigma-70 factor (ECF subfamily)
MTIHVLARSKLGVGPDKIRSRDRDAWNQLVAAEHQRLFNLHLRLCGDRDTAADLTQETFKTAFETAQKFAGRCAAETWLYAVALNVSRNWYRRAGRVTTPELAGDTLPDPEPSPEQLALLHEESHLVYEAVAALPEIYREAVALRYFADVPAVQIADQAGIPAETVRWRLHRGLQLLWAALSPRLGKEQNHDTAAR